MPVDLVEPKPGSIWPIIWKSALIAAVLFIIGVTVMFPVAVLQMILPDQTVYSSGFSEERFAQLRSGMEAQQVLSILGPPLEIVVEPDDRQTYRKTWSDRVPEQRGLRRVWWNYSRPGHLHDSFNVRSVEVSSGGRVVAIERYFHQD